MKAISGGSSIGGSAYDYRDFLIDFGAIQGPKGALSYPELPRHDLKWGAFSHDHFDHIGNAMELMREYPELPIFATGVARHGTYLQLKGSARIARKDTEFARLSGQNPDPPRFTEEDTEIVFERIRTVKNTGWFEPAPGYKVSFRSAGHKPGAVIILIVCPDGTRIIHACDVSIHDQGLVRGAVAPQDFLNPDILVTECTYGSKSLPHRSTEEARLVEKVREVLGRGGKVVIPHFASTCQSIALTLARAGIPSILDGMARDFWWLYNQPEGHWCDHDVKVTDDENRLIIPLGEHSQNEDWVCREEIRRSSKPVVIISTGGMLDGGPAVKYVEDALEDHRSAVLIPGHQADESTGRKLLQLERNDQVSFTHKRIVRGEQRVWEEHRTIKAEVVPMKLSGHSDGDAMADWVCAINPKRVVTVHGEPASHAGLKERIQRRNGRIDVTMAENGVEIPL